MLVLSRKTNERIVIDGIIEVVVLSVQRDRVRLGIAAPKDTEIHRKEVYERIHGVKPAPEPDPFLPAPALKGGLD